MHVAGRKGIVEAGTAEMFPGIALPPVGEQANVAEHLIDTDQVQGWLREFFTRRNTEADHLTRLVTSGHMTRDEATRAIRNMGTAAPPLQAAARTGRGAARSAGALGAINRVWTDLKGTFRNVTGPAKPALAAGLGIAALAGLMTTTLDNDDRIRAKAPAPPAGPRPGAAAGVTDTVPDEPVAGSEAPSNPKREVIAPAPGVETAVVAPVNRVRRLEVKAQAPNRDALREVERLLASSPNGGGRISVTRNYSRPQESTLRQRERIKEQLNQQVTV